MRRAFLSLVLVFQLAVVIIGPNKDTYHGYLLAPIFEPIYSGLELGSNWSFFAPDPGPAPVRLEWEVLGAKGEILRTGFFPDEGYPYWINERQTRRVALARFFYFADDRHLNVWSSWLCRSNRDASGVRLWKAESTIPNLFKVQKGEETITETIFGQRKSVGTVFCDPVTHSTKSLNDSTDQKEISE
jgi:hypothetical protein